MFRTTLYGHYGLETLFVEFKEFCLKVALDMYISEHDAECMLQYSRWDDKLVEPINKSLELYMDKILPRYVSSFTNANIDGEFVIGVSDNGEITGIPYKGHLSTSYINKLIQSSMKTMIKGDFPKLDVNVVRLAKNEDIIAQNEKEEEDYVELYNEYKRTYMLNNDIMFKYNKQRVEWLSELGLYSNKLHTMINSRIMRDEILLYVCTHDNTNSKQIEKIKILLKGDDYIQIPEFSVLQERKINRDDVLFWLVEYRDNKKKEIVTRRPPKLKLHRSYSPLQIVSKLSRMRKVFCKSGDVHYYMIIIKIYGTSIKDPVYYKNTHNHTWIKRCRKLHHNGSPYSV
jgi:hypothetical protein